MQKEKAKKKLSKKKTNPNFASDFLNYEKDKTKLWEYTLH